MFLTSALLRPSTRTTHAAELCVSQAGQSRSRSGPGLAQVTLSTSCAGSGCRRGARRRGFKALHVKRLPLRGYLPLHLHTHTFRGQRLAFLSARDEEISRRSVSVFPARSRGSPSERTSGTERLGSKVLCS